MKDKMDEKQTDALRCLEEIIKYASINKLSMRIMDELEDCKKQISSRSGDWTAVNQVMDDLLNSIEEKTVPHNIPTENAGNEVPAEMVKGQIEEMAKRCRADNTSSIDSISVQKNAIIKKNCEQLMEISHTKAHMEELTNEDLYIQFFQNCKTKYERDCFEMFRGFLQSVSGNYNHMMNHMKSMFQSIGGYKSDIDSKKFYYEYEEIRTGIDQKVEGQIQTEDIGGDEIMSFAQRTKEHVKNIVKKLTLKKKLFAWLPFLVLLCVLMIGVVGKMAGQKNDTKQVETDVESDGSFFNDALTEFGKKALKENSLETIVKGLPSVLSNIAAALALVVITIVLLYMLYLRMLRKWRDHQIGRQCGEYLKTELIQFEQTNGLSAKLDAAMEYAVEEYEQQYINVLNNLFQGSQYHLQHAGAGSVTEFASLRAEWNRIQNL